MKKIVHCSLLFTAFLFATVPATAQRLPAGKTYSGRFFHTDDWGTSYETSATDRARLKKLHGCMMRACQGLLQQPGDYIYKQYDLSFAFDSVKQQESLQNGVQCVTCYYSYNPEFEIYFRYYVDVTLSMVEESETNRNAAKVADSLGKYQMALYEQHMAAGNTSQTQAEMKTLMEEYEKETAAAYAGGKTPDEKTQTQLAAKAKKIADMGKTLDNATHLSYNETHNIMAAAYLTEPKLRMISNQPLLQADVALFRSMAGKPAEFFYKELTLPGCSFACIYLDRFNKYDKLFHKNMQLVAYVGTIYPTEAAEPTDWVNPFCVKITLTGNLQQIEEFYPKLDMTQLAAGLMR